DQGCRTGVHPRELERDPSAEHRRVLELAGLLPGLAVDAESCETLVHLGAEHLAALPQAVRDRSHGLLEKLAQLDELVEFAWLEAALESVEVAVEGGERHRVLRGSCVSRRWAAGRNRNSTSTQPSGPTPLLG